MTAKFLIVGASSGTGIHLTEQLLSKSCEVGIVIRNTTKAKEIFKSKYDTLKTVVNYEFGVSKDNSQLEKALAWADVIINNMGPVYGSNSQVATFDSMCELINLIQKLKDFTNKKFIMISSLLVTSPYHPISWILNTIIPYVLGWKLLAENELRKSKLNYIIVRPGHLKDGNYGGDLSKLSPVLFSQGDKIRGPIHRENLANTIINLVDNKELRLRTTIDVEECKEKQSFDVNA